MKRTRTVTLLSIEHLASNLFCRVAVCKPNVRKRYRFPGPKRYGSSSSYSSYSPPVPDRWLKCPRRSFTTISGKFVAFKTPLDSKYDNQVPIGNKFNTEVLFSSLVNMKVVMYEMNKFGVSVNDRGVFTFSCAPFFLTTACLII